MSSLTPFLYPFSAAELRAATRFARRLLRDRTVKSPSTCPYKSRRCTAHYSTVADISKAPSQGLSHLNPSPDDYNITPFVDKCAFTVQAGNGGNGCVSFLREKYVPEGPPNGGDGGSGGNIFIQAVKNCTSLNQIARKREYQAGRGHHGMGSSRGGKRGDDILLEVPVGTTIREIKRWDPVAIRMDLERQDKFVGGTDEAIKLKLAEQWLLYPGLKTKKGISFDRLPRLPKARPATIAAVEPEGPIRLDLDAHMEKPILLAAGALGGYGNPHFASKEHNRPKVATKGDHGKRIALALELKLVADIGLVGLPNAGKSTLLRAISNSRARIGNWAFTTLQPNIGTVVLDNYQGRPSHSARITTEAGPEILTRFTVADIPGIIQDAHLNKGLGLDFLRHIERAKILAFVVDLSAGDAVTALQSLWREVGEYQNLKDREQHARSLRKVAWNPFETPNEDPFLEGVTLRDAEDLPPLVLPSIAAKPWFVVATKADKPETQDNFAQLHSYVQQVASGKVPHPSGRLDGQRRLASAVPISGIQGQGIDRIVDVVVHMLS